MWRKFLLLPSAFEPKVKAGKIGMVLGLGLEIARAVVLSFFCVCVCFLFDKFRKCYHSKIRINFIYI